MTAFADLPEHQATGRIAEIYDEIRVYGAVPYVLSLQRQLATIPGCLEWVWEAVRPAFVDGRVPLAAWGAVEDLELPAIAPIPRPALRVLGVDAEGETALHSIYETFLRASPVNMVTASLMACMLGGVPDRVRLTATMRGHGSHRHRRQRCRLFRRRAHSMQPVKVFSNCSKSIWMARVLCRVCTGSWHTGRHISPTWLWRLPPSSGATTSSRSVRKS